MKRSFPDLLLSLCLVLSLLTPISSAKLVAWYPLDESASDTTPAAAENVDGNNATTLGLDPDPNLTYITRGNPSAREDLGTSYLFTRGGGLDLGTDPAVQPTDKFTISFWFQPGTHDAFDRFVESMPTNNNAQNGIRIDMGGGNGIRVQVRDGNGAVNTNFSHPTTTRTDGTWYFFAFRYDSAGVDNAPFQLTLVEATGDPVDEAAIAAATSGPATINVGAINTPHEMGTLVGLPTQGAAGNPDGNNNLHAAMDELAFYDNSDGMGVLSDAQLADVYNFGPSTVDIINSFTSDLDSVDPGNPTATLSWSVTEPFDSLVLDDGMGTAIDVAGDTVGGIGSRAVTPTTTTVYSLRATRGEAVNVSTLRILASEAPVIDSFTASSPIIQSGDGVDLSWVVSGADSLQLDPGAVNVSGMTTSNQSPTETTTYMLSATNIFGTSTADVSVEVIDGPVPTHRYIASADGNTDLLWIDDVSARDWALANSVRNLPLATESPNTNIGGAYSTGGEATSGGSTGSFQYPDVTIEVWFRPAALSAAHQVIIESGGGQNGISALITEDELRFLGTLTDVRNLDITLPIAGLNLEDFVQLVITVGSDNTVGVSVRDTYGTVRTASEIDTGVVVGNNGAGLFTWASGAARGTDEFNLGGATQLGPFPTELSGFAGEIGIVNIYDRILDSTDIQAAFDAVATVVDPPTEIPFWITMVDFDEGANAMTLTWTSIEDNLYQAQFSSALDEWFDFGDAVTGAAGETTATFILPPNQTSLYLRILDRGAD